jgi:uncharacterized protein with FMN-binding domain
MKKQENNKKKRKGKVLMIILIIIVIIIAILGGALLFTSGERKEGKNLPIANIDFKNLKDGTYVGEYEGGRYKLRSNRVQVTVSQGKVTDIKILEDKQKQTSEFTGTLYGKVIEEQSLQVDAISGATITSKAYLKSVEKALSKAEK